MRSGMPGASGALRVVSIVCRAAAWLLALLTVCDAVLVGAPRSALLGVNGAVLRALPAAVSGLFVFQTPFGGVFHGDFALAAIVLLVFDWLVSRLASSLR